MKHHFGDFLDRTANYWTMVPNRERFAYANDVENLDKQSVKILTISKDHVNWKQVFDCPHIEEVTLHDPSQEQVEMIQKLKTLKRLRMTFFRTKNIDFIENLTDLEEVVFEYVSGFSDLSPLKKLTKLRSLHLENLRRVSDFDGLTDIKSLQYLHIDGTFDWNQPINNFNFLNGLPNLEVFSLGFITSKTEYPALLPIVSLKKLKKIKIGRSIFKLNEYAFLQVALPNVEGCSWDICMDLGTQYDFLGKGTGYIKKTSKNLKVRCDEFEELYNNIIEEAKKTYGELASKLQVG